MADKKKETGKVLTDEEEMKKRYRLLLQLEKVEMAQELELFGEPKPAGSPARPKETK
jgi:hypothetical protein